MNRKHRNKLARKQKAALIRLYNLRELADSHVSSAGDAGGSVIEQVKLRTARVAAREQMVRKLDKFLATVVRRVRVITQAHSTPRRSRKVFLQKAIERMLTTN